MDNNIKACHPKHITIDEYDYSLPDERIAKFPLADRDGSKLLLYKHGSISHTCFKNIAGELPSGSLLVCNNTRVIQARIVFAKETGARIEVFCFEPHEPSDYNMVFQTTGKCVWQCMVGNSKKWKDGSLFKVLSVGEKQVCLSATKLGQAYGTSHLVEFSWDDTAVTFAEILDAAGELPIPPYLHRDTCESDKLSYQTVYSKVNGSVAAPTAGLHFTPAVFDTLSKKEIEREEVTLHVGAGTFRPVKSDTIGEHDMHTEFISVRKSTVEKLLVNLGKVIAVGTTSVRTLESLYYIGVKLFKDNNCADLKVEQWMPYEIDSDISVFDALKSIVQYLDRNSLSVLNASTQIIIAPGYKFKVVSGIVTNFHQPKSTLLLLVSAFVGDDWHRIYDYAMTNDFRFLSYGDSSLLLPDEFNF